MVPGLLEEGGKERKLREAKVLDLGLLGSTRVQLLPGWEKDTKQETLCGKIGHACV